MPPTRLSVLLVEGSSAVAVVSLSDVDIGVDVNSLTTSVSSTVVRTLLYVDINVRAAAVWLTITIAMRVSARTPITSFYDSHLEFARIV